MLPAHMEWDIPYASRSSEKEFPAADGTKIISTAEIRKKNLLKKGIDFIISTAKLNLTFPNVYVNSILTETDKENDQCHDQKY